MCVSHSSKIEVKYSSVTRDSLPPGSKPMYEYNPDFPANVLKRNPIVYVSHTGGDKHRVLTGSSLPPGSDPLMEFNPDMPVKILKRSPLVYVLYLGSVGSERDTHSKTVCLQDRNPRLSLILTGRFISSRGTSPLRPSAIEEYGSPLGPCDCRVTAQHPHPDEGVKHDDFEIISTIATYAAKIACCLFSLFYGRRPM